MKNLKTITIIYSNLVLLIIDIFLIYLVDIMNFKFDSNHGISGNGNPAIVLFFVIIPFIAAFIYSLITLINRTRVSFFQKSSYVIMLIAMSLILAYLQYLYTKSIYQHIDGALEGFGLVNQYTNTIFINGYTFLITVLISLIVHYFWNLSSRGSVR